MRFGIAYKPGRTIASPEMFDTREQAEEWLRRKAAEYPVYLDMHVVETDGSIGVSFGSPTPALKE
jgi:hypothetical protein